MSVPSFAENFDAMMQEVVENKALQMIYSNVEERVVAVILPYEEFERLTARCQISTPLTTIFRGESA